MSRLDRIVKDEAEFASKGWVESGLEPVLFFGRNHPEHQLFSNFTRAPLVMDGPGTIGTALAGPITYGSPEHRYQAMKAGTAKHHQYVVEADTPYESKKRGREIPLRMEWGGSYGSYAWFVMLEVVLARADQHRNFRHALLDTKGRLIYEDSPTDDIWGWRYRESYSGKNLLGLALMTVRAAL